MQRLRDLVAGGIAAVPPTEFDNLAESCLDLLHGTGDARYAVLADLFTSLSAWWAEKGGVPEVLANEIERLLRQRLGEALDAEASEGFRIAERLAQEVAERELPDEEWFRLGYVRLYSHS